MSDGFNEEKDKNRGEDGPRFPFEWPKLPNVKLPGGRKFALVCIAVILAGIGLFHQAFAGRANPPIDFSEFMALIRAGEIRRVRITDSFFVGFADDDPARADPPGRGPGMRASPREQPPSFRTVPINHPELVRLMDEMGVSYYAASRDGGAIFGLVLSWLIPIAFIVVIWRFMMKRMGSMGGGVLSVGQNRAVIVEEGDIATGFGDVAGVDEAKEELVEVVDFLKSPQKYTDIGGKIPKGVLLIGPPGTGKTLLARAVAGEAGVSFFRMSGADFVEMFVGVGAARVRDLFKQARDKAPCIVFIDELDAIGKSRINNVAGGNDEREQTLNQLLVEMDGFAATGGLIVLAATNRPDVLDPALLRPGRFDRQVLVDRPDVKGREAILLIHARPVKLDPSVDLAAVARGTSGFAGADLANIVNEAALLAVRAGRTLVSQRDFSEAIEKTVAGLQKKTKVISPRERRVVAYHETGHAMIAAFTPGADPVQKISIVPRGLAALGYTLQMPTEDRHIVTEEELLGKIDVLMGGRAAEDIVFGEISTGAANDLTKATDIARSMITDYGMSDRFRNVALTKRGANMLGDRSAEPAFHREYSESTQQYIDEEIARIVDRRYAFVKEKLEAGRCLLEKITGVLLERETLDEKEFRALMAEPETGR